MNRVIKTVKTYDYGQGVRVEKENGKIVKIWIDPWEDYVAFNSDGVHKGRDFLRVGVDCNRDAIGKYCYFVNKDNYTTVVVWETRSQLLKSIPKVISQNRASLLKIPGKEKGTAYKSADGRSVSHEMAQREDELERFLSDQRRVVQAKLPIHSEMEKAADTNANELNDGNIMDHPCCKEQQEMDSVRFADLKLLMRQKDSKYTLGEILNKVSKEIVQDNNRLRLLEATKAAQSLYGTLYNCLRIFCDPACETILDTRIDYKSLFEPIEDGFDVAVSMRQTKECAEEELKIINELSDDDVLRLLGALDGVF